MAKNIIIMGIIAESKQKRKTVVISVLTELAEVVEKTLVTVSFELQKSTKIMMKLFFVLALLLEMTLLILWIMNRLTTLAMLCYPLGLMIFICTLSTIGLYFTSREILGILFEALTCENTKNAPSIHKSNHIE